MNRQRAHVAIVLAASVCLGGCAATAAPPQDAVSDREPPVDVAEPASGIEEFDFGSTEWQFSVGGAELPISVPVVDGIATVDTVRFEVGEPIYSDADGDGSADAAVPISRADGNGFETLWYLWHDSGDTISQVVYPIARQARCGTAVESVTATDDGFVVHEFLRLPVADDSVPCSDPGTGELTRTVALHDSGDGTLWPVLRAPIPAFGGLCPGSPWLDGVSEQVTLLAAPTGGAVPATTPSDPVGVFELYRSPLTEIEGWKLVGFVQGAVDTGTVRLFCGWHEE